METYTNIDVKSYVESNTAAIRTAGWQAYRKLGRGALCVMPQRDDGNGKTSVRYLTKQVLAEDEDPALQVVERYRPDIETVLIVILDNPKDVITYLVTDLGAMVMLQN